MLCWYRRLGNLWPRFARYTIYLVKLVTTYRFTEAKCIRAAAGIEALRPHLRDLIDYLEASTATLVNYGAMPAAWRTHFHCVRRNCNQ